MICARFRILLIFFLVMPTFIIAQTERKYIRQGNQEYNKKLYNESEVLYRKALEKDQRSYQGNFNLGDALYKQEKYDDASQRFSDLTNEKPDKVELSRTYHNLGNSLLKANKLEESIEAYKNALRNNPYDADTKHNLAYAMNLLQQQQQQQQQQENKENRDQENQDQKDQQEQQEQNETQQQQQQDMNKDEISKDDANRILEALQQDEQKLLEELNKQKVQTKRIAVIKDW